MCPIGWSVNSVPGVQAYIGHNITENWLVANER